MSRRHVTRDDPKGTRLIATAEAVIAGLMESGQRGTLVGFGRRGSILVRKDGIKTAYSYHPSFWRRAQTDGEKGLR